MKTIRKGPPREVAAPVSKPYGLPALMEASAALVKQHVLTDVTGVVRKLHEHQQMVQSPWLRFLNHTGWVDPGGRLALMDFEYNFPHRDTIQDLSIQLLCYRIEGGNGEPLYAGPEAVKIKLRFDETQDGSLRVYRSSAETPEWNEWMELAREAFKRSWLLLLQQGELAGLSSTLGREPALRRILARLWSPEAMASILNNTGLDLVLLEDEADAEEHCSTLEFRSEIVHLVTPWLATELEKRGEVAAIVQGLPLWSRATRDEPHLDRAMQDIAYDSFSQSMKNELASTPKE